MANTRVPRVPPVARASRVGLVVAVLLATASVLFTPSAASACSFAGAQITIEGQPTADGTLVVDGTGFFDIEGSGVGADCSGNYSFVPQDPVTVIISFETLSGPRAQAVVAPVAGEPIDSGATVSGSTNTFSIHVEVPIPADATSVNVKAGWAEADATISGAVATTVLAPPSAEPSATPATPVTGTSTFTG